MQCIVPDMTRAAFAPLATVLYTGSLNTAAAFAAEKLFLGKNQPLIKLRKECTSDLDMLITLEGA